MLSSVVECRAHDLITLFFFIPSDDNIINYAIFFFSCSIVIGFHYFGGSMLPYCVVVLVLIVCTHSFAHSLAHSLAQSFARFLT